MPGQTSFAFIVFGSVLIYLTVFGLTVPYSFAVSQMFSDDFNDNSIDLTKWEKFDIFNTGGGSSSGTITLAEQNSRLEWVTGTTGVTYVCHGLVTKSSFLLKGGGYVSVKIPQVMSRSAGAIMIGTRKSYATRPDAASENPNNYLMNWRYNNGLHLAVCQTITGTATKLKDEALSASNNAAMKIEISNSLVNFWYDDGSGSGWVLYHSTTDLLDGQSFYFYVFMVTGSDIITGTLAFDDAIVYGETGSSQPTTGNIFVQGFYEGNPISFSSYYTLSSSGQQGPTVTVPTSGYTWTGLAPASYTVYGVHSSYGTKHTVVTVTTGGTATATINFGGSLPTTGNIVVKGYANGIEVSFSAYYVGPSGASVTVSVPVGGYTWSNLQAGSYTIHGTHNTYGEKSTSVTVTSGQTVTATLTFSGTPPDVDDPFQIINDFLKRAEVRALMTIAAISFIGVGFVGLIPKRRKEAPPRYREYDYGYGG